ncbi:MAG TPA: NAD-dependent epimerase/dehydratase family protein [Rubricoccaceae bacterium]|jgi:nucleoside-diphosphate-sugar epimerase
MPILVTGATGFLGGAVARRLAAEGRAVVGTGRDVRAGAALERDGVRFVRLDLTDTAGVRAAVAGCDAVVHSAALAAPWGPARDFWAANVVGTQTIVGACRAAGVRRLVHVSTPSVCFGAESRENVAEADPLPAVPLTAYAATKRVAEVLVAEAVAGGLDAIVIRPRAIYGSGDRVVLPRLAAALRAGRLPRIGDGTNWASVTYIGTAVDAVLACLDGPPEIRGRFYHVADAEPVAVWDMVGRLAAALGVPAPSRHLSTARAMRVAATFEWTFGRLGIRGEPPLTRYGVSVLAHTQTLDVSAIRRDLSVVGPPNVERGLAEFVAGL